MRAKTIFLLFISISTIFFSCFKKSNYKKISKEITGKYYPTRIFQTGDSLVLISYLPERDFISSSKRDLIREFILTALDSSEASETFDVLNMTLIKQEDTTIKETYLMSKSYAGFSASLLPKDSTWNSWAYHIMKNINGVQIEKYNTFIRLLVKDYHMENQIDSASRDLIRVLAMFSRQCRGENLPVNYSGLLHAVDSMSFWASHDGVIWNHDYDQKQLKYFFDQCDLCRKTIH